MSILYHYITGIKGFGEGVGKLECYTSIIPTAGKHQSSLDRYDCGFEFTVLSTRHQPCMMYVMDYFENLIVYNCFVIFVVFHCRRVTS